MKWRLELRLKDWLKWKSGVGVVNEVVIQII
jgi:hypothetical protein